jgi:alpha-ketoglutarate-dependent taurine dioxygenase
MEQVTTTEEPATPAGIQAGNGAPLAAAGNGVPTGAPTEVPAGGSAEWAGDGGRAPLLVAPVQDEDVDPAADAIDTFLERAETAGLAPATPAFFNAAEILEGALPDSVRAALCALRRGAAHAVVVRGLPSDPDPGPTPAHAGELPPAPARGNAWLASCVRRLGDEFAYEMEKKGATVHNVHPTYEGANTQSNAGFKVDLSLHTENAFHPLRPDFVCLYCVRSPADAPATRLVVLDDILAQLTDHEIEVLRQPRFTIRVVDSHRAEGEADIELPLVPLTGSPRRPLIRWHETLRANDDVAARVCRAFEEAARSATRHVRLEQGDLLAFANHTCLHGRDRFDARLDGSDRWVLRGYAMRDLTQTTHYVAPARPRVTRVDLAVAARA